MTLFFKPLFIFYPFKSPIFSNFRNEVSVFFIQFYKALSPAGPYLKNIKSFPFYNRTFVSYCILFGINPFSKVGGFIQVALFPLSPNFITPVFLDPPF